MNSIKNKDYVFLFSSFEPLPDNFFQGYCFVENDYIIGQQGANKYPGVIPAFSDGCYISITKVNSSHYIGVDSNGFKKIFLYNKNGIWAISNSISVLSKFLKSKGVDLTCNYPALATFFRNGNVGQQISTLKTVFNEIVLFPHEALLVVKDGLVSLQKREPLEDLGYVDNLKVYIDTWVSRIETLLLNQEMKVITDLTGGIDSRTTYSLFKFALERSGLNDSDQLFIKSGTAPIYNVDLKCAQNIVDRYNGTLNTPTNVKAVRYGGKYAYRKWKDLNLGNYLPIYIPMSYIPENTIYFGGGGGETHRSVYGNKLPTEFASRINKRLLEKYELHPSHDFKTLLEEHTEQFADSVERLKEYHYRDSTNPLVLHYKEFRNRFHAGRGPQYGRTIAPLGSDLLNICSMYCEKGKLERGQILYDIMESLCPGLAIMPYDSERKFPSYDAIKNISLIPVSDKCNPGKVYKNDVEEFDFDVWKDDKTHPLIYVQQELNDFIVNYENNFFTEDFIQDAKRFMDESVKNGRFTHAADAMPVSHILTYKMILDACR